MFELYLKLAVISPTDKNAFVFRSLTKVSTGYVLRKANNPMSYTRVRELIVDAVSPLVDDVSKFSLHSLRAGGASAAANSGVSDRLFYGAGRRTQQRKLMSRTIFLVKFLFQNPWAFKPPARSS